MKDGAILSRAADARVRRVPHAAIGVTVMAEQALHLVLHIAGLDAPHDLLVRVGGNSVRVPNHFQLHVRLEDAKFRDHRMQDHVVYWVRMRVDSSRVISWTCLT